MKWVDVAFATCILIWIASWELVWNTDRRISVYWERVVSSTLMLSHRTWHWFYEREMVGDKYWLNHSSLWTWMATKWFELSLWLIPRRNQYIMDRLLLMMWHWNKTEKAYWWFWQLTQDDRKNPEWVFRRVDITDLLPTPAQPSSIPVMIPLERIQIKLI